MGKRLLATGVMTLALLILTHPAVAQAAPAKERLSAELTGAAEVPGPGDRSGRRTVQLRFDPDKGEVCYDLRVANMQDIQEATAAHIHEGAVGTEGPAKVTLEAPKTGSVQGCKSADVALIHAIMQNPTNYYVNVHTVAFPKGAIRGQLAVVGTE
jgi:CHRD domain